MSQYGVVAAEIARARIFTLEEAEVPEFDGGPNLVERRALENPQRKASEADIWTDTRRGAHREHIQGQRVQQTTGIPHHNYDEHREQNERDNNIAFAKLVVDELERVIKRNRLKRVVLCAEKQMLGFMRPAINSKLANKVELREVPKDLTSFTPHELHQRLANDGYLPPRKGRIPPG